MYLAQDWKWYEGLCLVAGMKGVLSGTKGIVRGGYGGPAHLYYISLGVTFLW
jgi:hypothetical protein